MEEVASKGSAFSEALVASLKQQRSNLLANGQKPLCDVELRCGGISTQAHSSVLASVSKFFERILKNSHQNSLLSLDLGKLFRGIESYFPTVIDSLYTGVQVVSPQELTNSLLSALYSKLELQLPFAKPHVEVQPSTVIPQVVQIQEENAMSISICPQCNMLFVSEAEFLAHTKLKCARKLICYTCGKLFTRVQNLATHLTEVRHGETVCSICGYEGESQKDAEMHIANHARDHENPYFCVFCDQRFSTRKRWEKHLPKHSSEAPFVCIEKNCGKAFKWKHALTAHSVIHADVKKFLCQECGFSTSHVSTFRFHSRIHSGNLMKCDVKSCTFQTTRKSNLVQHKLTHSKEKPHQCEICGRAFSLAKNMRRHARQHDKNATIFKCNVANCSFKTLRSDKYIEHVKKYHPNEPAKNTSPTPVIKVENSGMLTTSPFNTVSPPNKTVSDTYEVMMTDESHFDEALLLAAASATDEDISDLVTPLLS